MADYVSKEELRKFFEGIVITVPGRTRAEAISQVLKAVYNGIMELPTTDAVPVIRCKQCEYNHTCTHDMIRRTVCGGYIHCPVAYCSEGKRKEE